MSKTVYTCVFFICLLCCGSIQAQDFLLEGCYWDCPESSSTEIDEASFEYWTQRIQSQAAELGHNGFSYIWLPATSTESNSVSTLIDKLNYLGIQSISNLSIATAPDSTDRVSAQQFFNSFQLQADTSYGPGHIAALLNEFCMDEQIPDLFIATSPNQADPQATASWLNSIMQSMSAEANQQIEPKVPDYILREALRMAISDPEYDVRTVFQSSLRDATAISTYNLLTFVNNALFRDQNGLPGDQDDPIKDPLLAYAYTLTNNQLGMPAVFYADYYGHESGADLYLDQEPLKDTIDQLMKVHREYIHHSTTIEYLNRFDTDKQSVYLSAETGADASKALIYQLDGNNTQAGQANYLKGKRDLLVALNFASDTLRVLQEVNIANISEGDYFTDILGFSSTPLSNIHFDSLHSINNAIYLEVPPHSFSIWVQGSADPVLPALVEFNAEKYKDFVELSWTIPSEKDVKGYEVQRSQGEDDFKAIKWVDANSLASEGASYLHIDKEIRFNEAMHYRIKMVNKDEGFEYSKTEQVLISREELSVELAEGRIAGTKAIKVKSNFEDSAELVVFNAEGDKVLEKKQHIRKGVNQSEIDLNALPNGLYFINFSTKGNYAWTERILKF